MQNFAKTQDDLVVQLGRAVDGIAVPKVINTSPLNLRFDGNAVLDGNDWEGPFFIDAGGVKHIAQHDPSWQELACKFTDDLTFDGNTWRVSTAADLLEQSKQQAKELTVQRAQQFAIGVLSDYPLAEREGWALKLQEANAFTSSNDEADAPGLALEAALSGSTVADLAANVIAKSELTGLVPSVVAGIRRATFAAIDAAANQDAIDAALAAANDQARSVASSFESGDKNAIMSLA